MTGDARPGPARLAGPVAVERAVGGPVAKLSQSRHDAELGLVPLGSAMQLGKGRRPSTPAARRPERPRGCFSAGSTGAAPATLMLTSGDQRCRPRLALPVHRGGTRNRVPNRVRDLAFLLPPRDTYTY